MTQLEFPFLATSNRTVRFQRCLSCFPSFSRQLHHYIIEGHEYARFCSIMCAEHAMKVLPERIIMGESADGNPQRTLLIGRKYKYQKHKG